MKTIVAATDLFDPIELDLWGRKYLVLEPTRAIERKIDAKAKAIDELPDDAPDDQFIEGMVAVLDVMLDPVVSGEEKKVRAGAHLKALLKGDTIGRGHIERLYLKIAEAREVNPT